MDNNEYFASLSADFEKAYAAAVGAKAKGFDPQVFVETTPAQGLASRVEGIIGVSGIADIVNMYSDSKSRTEMVFKVVSEICTSEKFAKSSDIKRIDLSLRVGLAMLTEGVQVAPTEGIQGVQKFKNPDNSEYVAVYFAGPIRGAGGTAAAMSVAIVDYARKIFNIGEFHPSEDEVDRYVEEAELYHARAARLQYKPSDDHIRDIVKNCPVCIDGVATEDIEVGTHRDLKRIGIDGKEVRVPNRLRGGVSLVVCEGIAQKAKKLVKEVKIGKLDWSWLNSVIKVEVKGEKKTDSAEKSDASFLSELVAGRPIFAYPKLMGGFRLRYGRTRFTGIASKGFSPATMIITGSFIAVGTQLKIEMPGKGCVATPTDAIEGPFVKLRSGECMKVNDPDLAARIKNDVVEIISLGDILVTYGDFKKSNTPMQPSSYVEELWELQLKEAAGEVAKSYEGITFEEAYALSLKHGIPMHPKYLFEFQAAGILELKRIAEIILNSDIANAVESISGIDSLRIRVTKEEKRTLELINVPHKMDGDFAVLEKDYAQSLVASLGFASGERGMMTWSAEIVSKFERWDLPDTIAFLNSVAAFKIMKRSTFIAARLGRPEKAKERLMKPAPNVLFPIGENGGKERNISKAYMKDAKKFGNFEMTVNIARYVCAKCKRKIEGQYCYDCQNRAVIERHCNKCNVDTLDSECHICKGVTVGEEERKVNIVSIVTNAMKNTKIGMLPGTMKGVKGMMNKSRMVEPIEKGILRSLNGVYIFKDGTARFDSTDVPITHFYPKEIGLSLDKLKELGYSRDYFGNEITSDEQLVEIRHQDIIMNRRGGEYMLKVAKFVDEELVRFYKLDAFYNATSINDMIGQLVVTLSPHTSCGVLGRIIGFTDANVGLAHPYTITARRRNCDGDEDTAMLLLDMLINFSKSFLPNTIGGTMDAPIILTLHVLPDEIDDEVHSMEIVDSYPLEFYNKTMNYVMPSEINLELVQNRLGGDREFCDLKITHGASIRSLVKSPKKSSYTEFKTMQDKVDAEFDLMDKIDAVDKKDAAKKVILSHFIPDLIGNLNSFSKQTFRCVSCNAKYRRVPLAGKCRKCSGKLLLTISRGGIEKYLEMAIALSEKYDLEPYIQQRLKLVKHDILVTFGEGAGGDQKQFNLAKFM